MPSVLPPGPRKCRRCGEVKPLEDFKQDKRMVSGYTSDCKDCWNAGHRQWRRDNPEGQKRRARRDSLRIAGVTPEQFDAMLAAQGGRCAICRSADPGANGSFHVDHDHSCCPGKRSCGRCVRALLCHFCNALLGYAKDDPAILLAAVQYLDVRKEAMHDRSSPSRAEDASAG